MPLPKGVKKVREKGKDLRWYSYRGFTAMFVKWEGGGGWQVSLYDDQYDYDLGAVIYELPFQQAMSEFCYIADGRRDEWTPQDYADDGADISALPA